MNDMVSILLLKLQSKWLVGSCTLKLLHLNLLPIQLCFSKTLFLT